MQHITNAIAVALKLAVALGVVGFLLKLFFVESYEVTHNGMAPNIVAGDVVLVWRDATADLGDIMLCEHPAEAGVLVLGRPVAYAGHTISTDRFGNIYVDQSRSTTESIESQRFYDVTRSAMFNMVLANIQYASLHTGTHTHTFYIQADHTLSIRPYSVNRGMYLLGDNRSDEIDDSRAFGEVDPLRCVGQVFMRLSPAPRNDDDIDHGYLDILR